MSSVLLILAYPLSIFFLAEPTAYRWGLVNGLKPMPPSVRNAAEKNGRILFFLQLSIVVSILFLFTRHDSALLNQLTFATRNPLRYSMIGIAAGLILILCRLVYILSPAFRTDRLPEHSFARGPLMIWLLSFVAAGAVEEVWRACCILSMQWGRLGGIASVGATSLAFAFAHFAGIPGRTIGIREEILWEFIFGIALGTLFIQFGSLTAPFLAGLLFNTLNLCLIRYGGWQ